MSESNIQKLERRFAEMQASDEGLRDFKVWYVGGHGPDAPPLEELAGEVLDILDADARGDYVDISEKLR